MKTLRINWLSESEKVGILRAYVRKSREIESTDLVQEELKKEIDEVIREILKEPRWWNEDFIEKNKDRMIEIWKIIFADVKKSEKGTWEMSSRVKDWIDEGLVELKGFKTSQKFWMDILKTAAFQKNKEAIEYLSKKGCIKRTKTVMISLMTNVGYEIAGTIKIPTTSEALEILELGKFKKLEKQLYVTQECWEWMLNEVFKKPKENEMKDETIDLTKIKQQDLKVALKNKKQWENYRKDLKQWVKKLRWMESKASKGFNIDPDVFKIMYQDLKPIMREVWTEKVNEELNEGPDSVRVWENGKPLLLTRAEYALKVTQANGIHWLELMIRQGVPDVEIESWFEIIQNSLKQGVFKKENGALHTSVWQVPFRINKETTNKVRVKNGAVRYAYGSEIQGWTMKDAVWLDYGDESLRKKTFQEWINRGGFKNDDEIEAAIDQKIHELEGLHSDLKEELKKIKPDWQNHQFNKIIEKVDLETKKNEGVLKESIRRL